MMMMMICTDQRCSDKRRTVRSRQNVFFYLRAMTQNSIQYWVFGAPAPKHPSVCHQTRSAVACRLPNTLLNRLQSVLNAAARLIHSAILPGW